MRKLHYILSALLIVLLLSGCGAVKTEQDWTSLEEATSDFTDQEILWEQTAEDEAAIKEKIDELLRDGHLTQMEAVQIALLNNRSLQSVFEEIGISRADLVQAGLLENPTLGALFRFPFDEDGVNIEAEAGFVLSDLWQIPFRKKVASAQMDATIMRVSEAVLDTIIDAKLAHNKVYYLDLIEEQADKALEKSREMSKETEKRRDFGFMSDLEVYLSHSMAAQAEMEHTKTIAELNMAKAHLNRVLGPGLERSDYKIVGENVEELSEIPELDSILQHALDHRPDVQVARLRIKESERVLKLEKVRILKHLDLGVSYEKEPEGSEVLGPGVELQIPIFDQNRASVAKARYMLRKAEKELQALEGQIREDIVSDVERIKLYVTRARIYRDKTIPLNQKALEYAEQWVGMMQLNRLYLLEAQEKLLESQQDYFDMLMELRHSLLDLERHAGGGSL